MLVVARAWWRSSIPFTKPRFVKVDGDLQVVNQPTVPPERLIEVLRDPGSWDLVDFEYHYDVADYRGSPLLASKLYALGAKAVGEPP